MKPLTLITFSLIDVTAIRMVVVLLLVITYIHPALKPTPLSNTQDKFVKLGLEVTVSKIFLNQDSFVVLGVYRPPNSKIGWFELFRDLITELLSCGKFIIMGDFNCNLAR